MDAELEHDEWQSPQWFTGSPYTHRVAAAITQYGPIARTTLAQLLGLSQGALSRITSDLLYANVIEELPSEANAHGTLPMGFVPRDTTERRGRPQTALRLRAGERTFIGINLHTEQATAVATDALCCPLGQPRTMNLPDNAPQSVVRRVHKLVEQCCADAPTQPVSIGISLGGHVKSDRYVTYAPFLHWDGRVDLAGMLTQACGIHTSVFNDLDSLLVHESWFGRGVGIPRFAVLTIGAGVGFSLSENGKPVDYSDKSYGLAGHVLVDPEGPRCYAGHIGCSQCLTSDSLAEEYSAAIGKDATFDDFARDAVNGKAQARLLTNKLCFRLGALTAMMANFSMPSRVLISGESSFLAKLGTESIRSGINWYRPTQASKVDFEILDFDWGEWAKSAASRVIERYIA